MRVQPQPAADMAMPQREAEKVFSTGYMSQSQRSVTGYHSARHSLSDACPTLPLRDTGPLARCAVDVMNMEIKTFLLLHYNAPTVTLTAVLAELKSLKFV